MKLNLGMIPYTAFVASQIEPVLSYLNTYSQTQYARSHKQTCLLKYFDLILKGLLHSNKQLSLLFTTSQSRSRSLFFFPSTSIMGNQSIAQYKDKSIRSVSCLFFRALRLKAKWISAVNTQRDEQLFERWRVVHLGVTIKLACGATLHVNVHIFCWQTPRDCSIIIFAVNFPFMLTETHLHKRYKNGEPLRDF